MGFCTAGNSFMTWFELDMLVCSESKRNPKPGSRKVRVLILACACLRCSRKQGLLGWRPRKVISIHQVYHA